MKAVHLGLALGIAALAAGGPATAAAPATGAGYYEHYAVTLPDFAVTNIVMFQAGGYFPSSLGYSITFPFSAPVGSSTITDPFLLTNPIDATFLLGVTHDLPGDAPGQQHLVVFTNNAWAASAQFIAFGTLFLNTLEDRLITDITTNLDSAAVGDVVFQQALDDLYAFAGGDSISGPNGNIAFGANDSFTAVAFSSGRIIGTGITSAVPAGGGSTVPEPASWALLIAGFGLTGAVARRRRPMALRAA